MSASEEPQNEVGQSAGEGRPQAKVLHPIEIRAGGVPAYIPVATGRPKGARNRLTQKFFDDMLKDWEANGAQAIASFRAERPHEYVKLVAGLLPRQLNVKVNELDELSDEQINEQFNALVAQLAAGGFEPGAGDGAAEAAEPIGDLPALS